jgi:NADP-dependent 3-hydroxy acid dehydrogenase YdfG
VLACDVRDPDACAATVASAVEQLGGLDGLVYAPGLAVITQLWKAGAAHWRSALDTNLVGAAVITLTGAVGASEEPIPGQRPPHDAVRTDVE